MSKGESMGNLTARIEAFYGFLWPFLAEESTRYAYLDDAPGGRPMSELLNAIPARRGMKTGSRLVDVGCGKGRQLVELARGLEGEFVGVDPLEQNLELASTRVRQEGLGGRVSFLKGGLERLPLETASVDFVWCLDMLNHVEDLDCAMRECARVLRPGGSIMNCSALATDLLEPREAERVTSRLGLNPVTLSPEHMRAAHEKAGLRVVEYGTTTDEGSPFLEEFDEGLARHALRTGKLLRARSRVEARLGPEAFELLGAYDAWNIFLLLGKVTYGVWVLEHASGGSASTRPRP
ncbi:class I SAM-dependent methyltransferase [Myxococcus stipitatus]|uniref:class I SAM-dependent methyltransferase n=1 Tax=Myxococcus stipitatus TaxID=83455 RepID=UPI0030CFD331